jgi:hypothetical protein
MSNAEYREYCRQQNDLYFRQQFRARFAPEIWAQMTPVQQEMAYQESRQRAALAGARWGFWKIVGVIVAVFVAVWMVLIIL